MKKIKVKIKIYGLGYMNNCQAHIKVYNSNNKLVFEGETYNGEIHVLLNACSLYKIYINTCNEKLKTVFYTNQNEFALFLNRSILNISRTITFLLKDYYYDNLPIERGELILWPKM